MADLVTSRQFTDGERGITAAKLNDIVASSVIQPAFYTSKPVAPTADPADIALILKGGAYAQVPISSLAGGATQAQIWNTRLRSFNAIGNPNFEVDQRNAGVAIAATNGAWACDRYSIGLAGTHTASSVRENSTPSYPGTSNFIISQNRLLLQLTAAEAVLGANDCFYLNQAIEGPSWREIAGAPFSLSLLVYSDIALKFSVSIRSGGSSLVKLCTVPAAAWTVVSLPNIPAPASPFSVIPGSLAANISVVLSCGSTLIAPAADTWQTGNFLGAPGMDNWSSKPVNTGFRIGFIQLEPSTVCTSFIDKPFDQNLDECLRYYTKSYGYGVKAGTITSNGAAYVLALTNQHVYGHLPFKRVMAKTPTVQVYDPITGGAGAIYDNSRAASVGVTGIAAVNDSNFGGCIVNFANPTAMSIYGIHYTADTGW